MAQRKTPEVSDWVDVQDWQDVKPSAKPTTTPAAGVDDPTRLIPTAGDAVLSGMENVGEGVKNFLPSTMGALFEAYRLGTNPSELWEKLKGLPSSGPAAIKSAIQPAVTLGKQGVELAVGSLPDAVQAFTRREMGKEAPSVLTDVPSPDDPRTAEMQSAAGTNLAANLVPALGQVGIQRGQQLINAIPSTKRAGAALQEIRDAGTGQAVNMNPETLSAIARAEELARTSGGRPPVLTKGTRRIMGPQGKGNPPLTYPESFDFASAAKDLSRADKTNITRGMQAQVDRFAHGLQKANREFADSVGKGKQFDLAMNEYRRAMKIRNTVDGAVELAKKYGPGALVGTGLTYAITQKFFN